MDNYEGLRLGSVSSTKFSSFDGDGSCRGDLQQCASWRTKGVHHVYHGTYHAQHIKMAQRGRWAWSEMQLRVICIRLSILLETRSTPCGHSALKPTRIPHLPQHSGRHSGLGQSWHGRIIKTSTSTNVCAERPSNARSFIQASSAKPAFSRQFRGFDSGSDTPRE